MWGKLEISKHRTVRVTLGIIQAMEEFMKSDIGVKTGFDSRADVVTAGVRSILEQYGYYKILMKKRSSKRRS